MQKINVEVDDLGVGIVTIREYEMVDDLAVPKSNKRHGFTPDTVDNLKDFSMEAYEICKDICTPEVIKKWEEYQKTLEEDLS